METALLCAILGSQTVTIIVQWVLSKIDAKRNPLREGVKELLFCKLKQFDEQQADHENHLRFQHATD